MITRIKLTVESLAVIAIATAFFAQTIYFQSKLRVPTEDISSQIEHNLHLLEEIREMHIGTNGKLDSIATRLDVRLSDNVAARLNYKLGSKDGTKKGTEQRPESIHRQTYEVHTKRSKSEN